MASSVGYKNKEEGMWSSERVSIELNGLFTKVCLNFLPLGSKDALIGMDWLERHRVKVDCYAKFLESIDEEGK